MHSKALHDLLCVTDCTFHLAYLFKLDMHSYIVVTLVKCVQSMIAHCRTTIRTWNSIHDYLGKEILTTINMRVNLTVDILLSVVELRDRQAMKHRKSILQNGWD